LFEGNRLVRACVAAVVAALAAPAVANAHSRAATVALDYRLSLDAQAHGVGAGVAALTLSWLGVFFHGVVAAALPATRMRIACAAALAVEVTALLGALSIKEAP
jgi:hypothetical protein